MCRKILALLLLFHFLTNLFGSHYLTLVAVARDDGGDEGGDPHSVGAGVGVVPVQLYQVVDGQSDADNVHEDPEEVDDVVAERALD